jgi:hypothetical protein
MKRRPIWYCPQCRSGQYTYKEPCADCGAEFVSTWKCKCGAINADFNCAGENCVNDKLKNLRAAKLSDLMGEILPNGQMASKRLHTYVMYTAHKRRIPWHVAVEAWGIAQERLLLGISTYNPTKGKFLHWAMRVCRNALLNAARDDAIRHRDLLSLDGINTTDDDLRDVESTDRYLSSILVGDILNLDTLIEREETQELFERQEAIARRELGTYFDWVDGNLVEIDVYDACVSAIRETDGKKGWQEIVVDVTGIPKYTISRRRTMASEAWRAWLRERTR